MNRQNDGLVLGVIGALPLAFPHFIESLVNRDLFLAWTAGEPVSARKAFPNAASATPSRISQMPVEKCSARVKITRGLLEVFALVKKDTVARAWVAYFRRRQGPDFRHKPVVDRINPGVESLPGVIEPGLEFAELRVDCFEFGLERADASGLRFPLDSSPAQLPMRFMAARISAPSALNGTKHFS